MSDFMSRANLAGAVDLSSLKRNDQTVQPSNSVGHPSATAINVPDLVALGTEENLKNFVTISNSVPVLVDFFAADLEASSVLSEKLERLVRALSGKMFLLRVDTQTALQVAKAFAIKEVPSVVALVKGQPIPIFEGDQTDEAIRTVLDRLLQVAAENGVSSTLQVSNDFSEAQVAELPPRHKAAYDAIDAGNYAEAVQQYQAALNDNPADSMAAAGLAQAKLLLRTDGIDFDRALQLTPVDFESAITKADACVAVGQSAEGYQAILSRFKDANQDEREKLRRHLLELFEISPPDAPELSHARRSLAALLY